MLSVAIVFLALVWGYAECSLEKEIRKIGDHIYEVSLFRDYSKYFKKKGKSHRVLLLVVGESMKQQCPYCHQFEEQFRFIAKHFYDAYSTGVTFSVLHFEQTEELMKIARDLQIQSVPAVFLYPKGQSNGVMCQLNQQPIYECIKTHFGVEAPGSLKGFIGEHKRKMQNQGQQGRPIGTSSYYYLFVLIFAPITIFLAVTTFFVFREIDLVKRYFVFLSLMMIYIFCLGCTVYNWIQTPGPSYGASIIYPQQRMQMYYEGYVAAFLIVLFTLGWIGLVEYLRIPEQVPADENGEPIDDDEKPKSFLKKRKHRLMGYIFFAIICFSFLMVFNMYIQKYKWYLNDIPYWNSIVQSVGGMPIGKLFEWYQTA